MILVGLGGRSVPLRCCGTACQKELCLLCSLAAQYHDHRLPFVRA